MGHQWVKSTLGHGETMCALCSITNREAAVLGVLDSCEKDDHQILHNSVPKHRARAVEAMARYVCSTDLTDGFCGPRDGKCQRPNRNTSYNPRNCMTVAEGLMKSMETVGVKVVWPYDKDQPNQQFTGNRSET